MPDATFASPDLTTFCRLDELGLVAVGQRLEPDRAVLECRVVEPDEFCHRCGAQGQARDMVTRRLAHEPLGWRPTMLLIRVRRYRCIGCAHVWRQDTTRAAEPRAKLSRRALRWALEGIVVQHLTVARIGEGLAVSWNTANNAVLAEGKRVLIEDPTRFDGVKVIGVDEHVWRHTRRGDKYVTVVIDLTPIRDGTGPALLLDMVEGRSKQVFKTWLDARPEAWKKRIEVVAMEGFTGFKTAAAEEIPDAVAVMDPFHVVRLGGDALDDCRRRVQQDLHGRRGRKDDPLYKCRRTLHTGADLLTDTQKTTLEALFADEEHVAVEATWGIYQRMIAAYRHPDRSKGRDLLAAVITSVSSAARGCSSPSRHSGSRSSQRLGSVRGGGSDTGAATSSYGTRCSRAMGLPGAGRRTSVLPFRSIPRPPFARWRRSSSGRSAARTRSGSRRTVVLPRTTAGTHRAPRGDPSPPRPSRLPPGASEECRHPDLGRLAR